MQQANIRDQWRHQQLIEPHWMQGSGKYKSPNLIKRWSIRDITQLKKWAAIVEAQQPTTFETFWVEKVSVQMENKSFFVVLSFAPDAANLNLSPDKVFLCGHIRRLIESKKLVCLNFTETLFSKRLFWLCPCSSKS